MIDYLHIELDVKKIPNDAVLRNAKPFNWLGLYFIPKLNQEKQITSYVSNFKNLRISLTGHKLILKNSIHKFYKDSNHDDFSLYDFKCAIQDISSELNLDINEAKIIKMEYGCNIAWDEPHIYNGLIGFRRGVFYPMLNGTRLYGKKQISTDYSIKMYDKQFEKRIHNRHQISSVLRFEKLAKKKYLNRIGIIKVKDLNRKKVWKKLALDLVNTYREIQKQPHVNLNDLSNQQLKELAVINSDTISKHLRKNRNSLYNRYKKNCSKLSDNTQYNLLGKKIKKKCKQLRNAN